MSGLSHSEKLFVKAQRHIPGGVNSPVRAFGAVGGVPRFIDKANGPYLFDVDNNRLIDCVCSWGTAILGHAPTEVIDAVRAEISNGLSFGAPCEREVEMAELLTGTVSWLEQVRMVNSGTEATMSAIRLARGVTKHSRIIKFAGCYHGHADCLLVEAGSGALTFGNPSSVGVPDGSVADTLVLEYNDSEAISHAFDKFDIAAVIVEPVAGNMNMVMADKQWLQLIRRLCSEQGALLIFDEVMSGFRVGLGGAAELFAIEPDLVCYGKVIGGGMPVGAFGGKAEYMSLLAPIGPVYQAGTLSGNPIAMTSGIATLKAILRQPQLFKIIENRISQMLASWQESAAGFGIPFTWQVRGGMFGFYFSNQLPHCLADVKKANVDLFKQFFHAMLAQKVYLAPSSFEAGFLSIAHEDKVILRMVDAATKSFESISKKIG